MSDFPRDLRSELRKRLEIVVGSYTEAICQYNQKKKTLSEVIGRLSRTLNANARHWNNCWPSSLLDRIP